MIYKVLQFKQIQGLNGERLGLTMIVASLVVICVLVGLLFGYQHRVQTADLRIRGVSLVAEELSNWQGERTFSATGFDRELIEQAESYLKRPFYVLESSEVMSILSLHVNKDV